MCIYPALGDVLGGFLYTWLFGILLSLKLSQRILLIKGIRGTTEKGV